MPVSVQQLGRQAASIGGFPKVKQAMALTPTYIRTNNVPGLTSAVRGPEGSPGSVRDVEKRDKPRRDLHKALLQQFGFPGPPGGTDAGRVYAGLGGSVPGPNRRSPYYSNFPPGQGAQMYKRSATADEGSGGFLSGLVKALSMLGVGAGGISAGTSADFLRRQLKHIKQYNPTVVTSGTTNPWYAGTARERVMPLIREGDVLVYGDSLRSPGAAGLRGAGEAAQQAKNVRLTKMRDLLSGGMGGFDEHSELITRSSKYPRDPLRSVLATNVAVRPAARRSPGVAMAIRGLTEFPKKYLHNIASAKKKGTSGGRAALPAFRRAWSGVLGDQFQQRRKLVDPAAKGSLTTSQLDDVLHQTYKQGPMGRTQGSMPMWQRLTVMGREPTPFSILRPKNYSQTKAHKYLKQVGNTTFDIHEPAHSAGLRRLMPRWATDLVEKIRNKVSPGASQAGAQCAGGLCKAVTGKGTYNLPSDLRHMKEFETVGDFIPQSALKQTGATRKNLEPLRKLMRAGAFKASLPGLIGGVGLAGLGMYGALNRK